MLDAAAGGLRLAGSGGAVGELAIPIILANATAYLTPKYGPVDVSFQTVDRCCSGTCAAPVAPQMASRTRRAGALLHAKRQDGNFFSAEISAVLEKYKPLLSCSCISRSAEHILGCHTHCPCKVLMHTMLMCCSPQDVKNVLSGADDFALSYIPLTAQAYKSAGRCAKSVLPVPVKLMSCQQMSIMSIAHVPNPNANIPGSHQVSLFPVQPENLLT